MYSRVSGIDDCNLVIFKIGDVIKVTIAVSHCKGDPTKVIEIGSGNVVYRDLEE